jgi:hypothetical protein
MRSGPTSAIDIDHAYVEAVNVAVRREAASISSDAIEGWSQRALAKADRIDPVCEDSD